MSMVVDIHKVKGIQPPFDVYIGRRIQYHDEFIADSKWANRFYDDLESYEAHVREHLWDDLDELDGKVLGCWCITTGETEPVQCHGQVLMRLLREKKIAHCEHMAEFWKKVCPSTAGQYANRAQKLREELAEVIV